MPSLFALVVARLYYLNIFLFIFILFFYLYGVHFTFLPTYTSRLIVFAAWVYLALLFLTKKSIAAPIELVTIGLLYFLYLAWVLAISAVYGFADISVLVSTVLLFLHAFVGGIFFAVIFKKMNFTFRQVILVVQVVIVAQAFFILLYFISWDFREFTFAYIPEGGNIDHRENLFRSRGLTHGSSATLSLIQSMGFLFTAYLVATVHYRSKQFIYLVLSFGLIFLSVFLTGRTGLLMIPVAIFYLFALLVLRQRISKNSVYFVLGVPVAAALLFVLLRLGYQYVLGGFSTAWGEDGFDRLIRWVVGEFFGSDGQVQSRTMQILSSHWFFPEAWHLFFFGDPTTWSLNRIPSDIGIVRLWHGVGLVGMLMLYALFVLVFLMSILKARGTEAKLMLAMLAVFLFIAEAKEPFLSNLNVNVFIILIFCYLMVSDRADRNRKSV